MIVESLLRFWLHSGRYRWSRVYRRLFEGRYLKYPLPAASSLMDIKSTLDQIQWTPDSVLRLFDCVSYPEATWVRKKDDCDGFSSLAAALIQTWKPECNPVLLTVIVMPVKNSHTVCVFTDDQDKLRFFDNNTLRSESYSNYGEIAAAIKTENNKLVCWDIVNPFGLKTIEFHRE